MRAARLFLLIPSDEPRLLGTSFFPRHSPLTARHVLTPSHFRSFSAFSSTRAKPIPFSFNHLRPLCAKHRGVTRRVSEIPISPQPVSKSRRIGTYRRTPRFAVFWPHEPIRKLFRICTYRPPLRKSFRIRTYKKTEGRGRIAEEGTSRRHANSEIGVPRLRLANAEIHRARFAGWRRVGVPGCGNGKEEGDSSLKKYVGLGDTG